MESPERMLELYKAEAERNTLQIERDTIEKRWQSLKKAAICYDDGIEEFLIAECRNDPGGCFCGAHLTEIA